MTIKIGDIILAPFPFTDLTKNKLRPALVLFIESQNITLVFNTSNLSIATKDDIVVQPDSLNRLRNPSLFKIAKLFTIYVELIELKYGALSKTDFLSLCDRLIGKIKTISLSY